MKHAIANEARSVDVHPDGALTDTATKYDCGLHRRFGRFLPADNFDERHQMRWVPEMCANELRAEAAAPSHLGDAKSRSAAAKNGAAGGRGSECLPELHLGVHVFGDAFDNKLGISRQWSKLGEPFERAVPRLLFRPFGRHPPIQL